MNGTAPGLYPIIRRVRRPLIIQDDDGPAAVLPREAVPLVKLEAVSYAKPTSTPRVKDAKRTGKERP